MTRARSDFRRPLLASALLHVAVLTAAMISWPWSRDLKIGTVVPVKIVANADSTDLRPAIQGPEPQTVQTEEPVPGAPAEMVSPTPEPVPPQPAPAPDLRPAAKSAPAPTPKTPAQKPPPAKPAPPTKADKGLDLDALAASLAKSTKSSGAAKSSAAKGKSRPETAAEARPAAGSGASAAAMNGLSEELMRRWNPNCEVEGGRDVRLRVRFILSSSGQVQGEPKVIAPTDLSDPVVRVAADRAIRAVYGAAPFRTLPREFYGAGINVNFDAREACSG